MITFIGDYTVRLDSKGRLSFPAAFKKQSREVLQDGFVLKRDLFENCLIMYPMEEWERQNPGEPYPEGQSSLIVAKHRNGPTGEIALHFNKNTTKFENLAMVAPTEKPALL